jgi:hypothetical protein
MILSNRLSRNLQNSNLKPLIVLQIEGISTLYTSDFIKREALYGDPSVDYGDPGFLYGGLFNIEDQETLISLEGTTTQIKQTLDPEKGRGSGVTSMKIVLVDKNKKATKLATGEVDGEILYRRCKVWVGFNEQSSFNTDFILVFRGIITGLNFGQGSVGLELASPEDKKRQILLPIADTQLNGAINNSVTTITLDSVSNLFVPQDHPSYSPKDTSLKSYVKIGDELIRYTGVSGLTITGCTRGQFGTTAASHADNDQVSGFFTLEGNALDLALKIMLSDSSQSLYLENLNANSVNINPDGNFPNSFFFSNIDLIREHNVQIGDWIKSTTSAQSANNLSVYTEIIDIIVIGAGTYIIVDPAAPLVDEATSLVLVDFLSKYNSLGFGLKLIPDEVDIEKHVTFKNSYLSNFDLFFYVREEISEAKSWIESELYVPATCYSLPSDKEGLSRLSVGIHKPPLPNAGILTLGKSNIIKPESLTVNRSSSKYYYNAVVYRYEDQPTDDKFLRRVFVVSGTAAIPTGNRTRLIESKGLREIQSAKVIATLASERLLERYQSASEYINNVQLLFAEGVQISVGDIVILDGNGLNLVNRVDFDRDRPAKLMEVLNKSTDIKTGKTTIDLIDTAFDVNAKYGLISASSKIVSISAQNKFTIGPRIAGLKYGPNEYRKWNQLINPRIKVRRADWSLVDDSIITNVNSNTITLQTNISFALQVGDIMELSNYSTVGVTDAVKLIYAFWSDGTNDFPDGAPPYQFA